MKDRFGRGEEGRGDFRGVPIFQDETCLLQNLNGPSIVLGEGVEPYIRQDQQNLYCDSCEQYCTLCSNRTRYKRATNMCPNSLSQVGTCNLRFNCGDTGPREESYHTFKEVEMRGTAR